ncbi:uncharacterized protein LOC110751856 [Prunus avium]|uniref:Uncharacterized protein LOC110751856 n=1 Tax=Prunus avium TaxID=42229 RepID=A0A6P5RT95_PRUAV|nr:uncharacterized protein LOC110751856 [Prunus avium]
MFFEIVRVEYTSSLTLKKEISRVLMNYDLQIDKMRGQGYDGASNMLQLALVAASKDVAPIWLFFSTLNSIINLITASPKCHGELQSTQEIDIAHMVDTGERETVVETLIKNGASNSIRGEATNYQWEELNSRFREGAMELLSLSSALDPSNGFKSFKIDDMCKFAEKFYPQDFTVNELRLLRCQLELFEFEATTERAFSAMKHVKTVLRNKMEDEYLADSLIVYIEKELYMDIDSDSIIKDFDTLKERRVPLH